VEKEGIMKWLERLRQETQTSLTLATAELAEEERRSDGIAASWAAENWDAPAVEGEVGLPAPLTSLEVAPLGAVPTTQPGTLRIPYKRIWFDFAIADGTYTPTKLRAAALVVKPWGSV
jgi:hypothetical protein